jgi:CRISPR/Cas system-associated exonuclease Cas4 (RecB family)
MPLLSISDLPDVDPYRAYIKELVDVYSGHLSKDDSHGRNPGIHPSEISECHRRAFYTMTNTKKKGGIDPKWVLKFNHGTALHEMIQNDWTNISSESGGLIEFVPEIEITPNTCEVSKRYKIYGHCDGVICIKKIDSNGELVDHIRMGLEIKSISPRGYESLTSPKPAHIEQAHVYMKCLDLPVMWLFYYNKGSDYYTKPEGKFLVKYSHIVWDKLEERFNNWLDHVERGTQPEKNDGIGCEFCSYTWLCKPKYMRAKNRTAHLIRRRRV